MPFKDRDKNKAYQAEWARQKKERTSKLDKKSGISSRPIRSGIVTWEELQAQVTYTNLKTYDECVVRARASLHDRRTDKMAIAALALRACEIRHGGDRRSEKFEVSSRDKTLPAFARAIAVNQKTLGEWVRVLVFIRQNIPKEAPIDYAAASILLKNRETMMTTETDVVANYHSLLSPTGPLRTAHNVIKFLQSARYALSLRGIDGWPPAEVTRLHNAIDALNEALTRIDKRSR